MSCSRESKEISNLIIGKVTAIKDGDIIAQIVIQHDTRECLQPLWYKGATDKQMKNSLSSNGHWSLGCPNDL